MTAFFADCFSRLGNTVNESPSIHQIFFATPYTSALCLAQARAFGSFSMAKIWFQRPESAKAIVLPPAPANASIKMFFDFGAVAMSWAILLY